jgi:putative transcription factor
MSCELCGKESRGCRVAVVDGVKMMLCPDCMRHDEGVTDIAKTPTNVERAVLQRIRRSVPKDIYKGMEKELVSNWPHIIKEARKKKGLSREGLGFKIKERTVTISKIEKGDLRPSDKMIVKLEKELGISLLEVVKEVSANHHSSADMTLGDFIKRE